MAMETSNDRMELGRAEAAQARLLCRCPWTFARRNPPNHPARLASGYPLKDLDHLDLDNLDKLGLNIARIKHCSLGFFRVF